MYKIYIYIALAIIIMPVIASANYNDVNLEVDTVITVGSYDLTVNGSAAAVVESIAVGPTSFTVVLPAGSSITVKSATKQDLVVTSGMSAGTADIQCSGTSYSTLKLSVPVGDQTQTAVITPSSSYCNSGGSSASGGSTGSSGGSSVATVAVQTPVVAPNVTPVAPVITTAVQVSFTTDLSRGITSADVTRLQQLLAQDKSIYPEGLVTGYFGPATENAVKRFQAKYGIDQVGRVGPITRAKLGVVFGTAGATPAVPATPAIPAVAPAVPATPATPATAPTTISAGSAVFTVNMSRGTSNEDVKRLQQLLNTDKDTQVASEGPGSPGNETDMYGSLTEAAIGKFQVKYNIAKPGDTGYGTVGPMTKAMLQEIFGAK